MIEGVRIECDERGFELVLVGDFTDAIERYEAGDDCVLRLRLPFDAAVDLNTAVRQEVAPGVAERDYYRRSYEAASTVEREAVLFGAPDRSDAVLDAADRARKIAKGE